MSSRYQARSGSHDDLNRDIYSISSIVGVRQGGPEIAAESLNGTKRLVGCPYTKPKVMIVVY